METERHTAPTRIQLTDSLQQIVVKMSDGNPGAINVMMALIKQGEKIDPDNMLGGVGAILWLDTERIYGPKIWVLFKDVCKSKVLNIFTIMRYQQYGFHYRLGNTELYFELKFGAHHEWLGTLPPFEEMLTKVKSKLPNFGGIVEDVG